MSLKVYFALRRALRRARSGFTPYGRRCLRFLALPRYFALRIAWEDCTASKLQVAADLLYIFFKLKYYPDNYSQCRLWTVPRERWFLYYGALNDPYQKRQLTRVLQPEVYGITLADKEVCHHLCVGLGLPVPASYGCVNPGQDLSAVITEALRRSPGKRLVVKPVMGTGGRSIQVVSDIAGEPKVWVEGTPQPLSQMRVAERSLVQEAVRQHPALEAVYAEAVNTVRLQTLLCDDGEAMLLGGFARFGRGHGAADNLATGGLGLGVDIDTGRLMPLAIDRKNRRYDRHPESGVVFDGFEIPHWREAIALALKAQRQLPWYRLVGLDVAITPEGPVIIEINPYPDSVVIEATSGPLLEREANAIAFLKHDLLINAPSKAYAKRLLEAER